MRQPSEVKETSGKHRCTCGLNWVAEGEVKLIIGQRSFHAGGVDQDAQKHQACGGSFKFVGGKGYAYLRGHTENGLDVVGTNR